MRKKIVAAITTVLLVTITGVAIATATGACKRCDCTRYTKNTSIPGDHTQCVCGHLILNHNYR